jgi:hypothetical protein
MSTHTQSRFAAALLDRVKETPPGLVSWSGARPVKRFGVYRNNVSTGLVQALAVRFPATEAIVGKEFFAAMAGAFVLQDPPRSPILLHYGSEFARYVEGFAPAAELSYLADVVRLENARAEAYHAADIAPLPPGALASIGGDRLEDLKLVFHPSFAVIRSLYPIVTIWAMNSGEMDLRPIEKWSGEDALVVRPQLSVLTRRLPPGGAVFLEALAKGQSLNSANERAQVAAAEFDLTANLAGIFQSGLVVAVSATPPVEG